MSLLWGDVIDWARHNLGLLMLASIVAYAFLLLLIVLLFARQNKLSRKLTQLSRSIQKGKSDDEA